METTKNASSSTFEQINKNLINSISNARQMQCLGMYCWFKANSVFTDNYEVYVNSKKILLNKDEICYTNFFLAKHFNIESHTIGKIIEEMISMKMITPMRKVETKKNCFTTIYRVNNTFDIVKHTNDVVNFTNDIVKNTNDIVNITNDVVIFDNNNNTIKETIKEKKKDTINDAPVRHSETFLASADETNYDKAMTEDDELMKLIDKQYNNEYYDKINTINTTMTKEDEEILSILNDEKNETTMTNQHLLDFENLDDKAYFKKYGKSKPLSYNENKERNNLIYNELYTFSCQLKAVGKSMTDEYIEYFKSHSELNPTDEEINMAIEKLKKASEVKSKVA